MRALIVAFALGVVAVALAEVLAFVALAVAADVYEWSGFRVGRGPVLLVEIERTDDGSAATLGAGAVLVACAGGLLNAGGAVVVRRV